MNSHSRDTGTIECQTLDERPTQVSVLEQEEENEFTGEDEDSVEKIDEKKNTNSQNTQEAKTMIERMKDLFIDVVNPKFKNFNRPVFLALAVGLSTLASFCALFVYLQTDCETQSMTSGTPLVSQFFAENDVKCMHWAVKLQIMDDGKQDFPPCRMVNMDFATGDITAFDMPICENTKMPEYAQELQAMETCTAQRSVEVNHGGAGGDVNACLDACFECLISKDYCLWAFDAYQEKDFNSFSCDFACTGSPDGGRRLQGGEASGQGHGHGSSATTRDEHDDHEAPQNDEHIEHDDHGDGEGSPDSGDSSEAIETVSYDAPAMMVIEFDLCPDPVLTLGSAFGWVAMIELASTLVILAVAMPLGFVENDLSMWKNLISTVNEEKQTIQEGGTDYVLESGFLQA